MHDLFEKPVPHPAKDWIDRIGAERFAVSLRLGINYSYLGGILSGHVPATPEIEQKLQLVIVECQEIYKRRNGETAHQK